MKFGPQVIQFECAEGTTCDDEYPAPDPSTVVFAAQFSDYLKEQSEKVDACSQVGCCLCLSRTRKSLDLACAPCGLHSGTILLGICKHINATVALKCGRAWSHTHAKSINHLVSRTHPRPSGSHPTHPLLCPPSGFSQNGYATLKNGEPVPEVVARIGIFIHWVADRASHWYCNDASKSGNFAVKNGTDGDYNLFLYLDPKPCSFVEHSMVHYWVCVRVRSCFGSRADVALSGSVQVSFLLCTGLRQVAGRSLAHYQV